MVLFTTTGAPMLGLTWMVNCVFLPRGGVRPVRVTIISTRSPDSIMSPEPIIQLAVHEQLPAPPAVQFWLMLESTYVTTVLVPDNSEDPVDWTVGVS